MHQGKGDRSRFLNGDRSFSSLPSRPLKEVEERGKVEDFVSAEHHDILNGDIVVAICLLRVPKGLEKPTQAEVK